MTRLACEERRSPSGGEYSSSRGIDLFDGDIADDAAIDHAMTVALGQITFGRALIEEKHDGSANGRGDVHWPSVV